MAGRVIPYAERNVLDYYSPPKILRKGLDDRTHRQSVHRNRVTAAR